MNVDAPVGPFLSTGLISTLAWLALPVVIILIAAVMPAFRRHLTHHRDQVREHLYGETATPQSSAPSAEPGADTTAGVPAPADEFDYSIYDDTAGTR